MTTVYIIRHSRPFRKLLGEYNVEEIEQLRNEKNPLSGEGEKLAELLSQKEELQKIDVLYSSHYVRAMSTAKYIAEENNINLNVDERLGERKFGVTNMTELPSNFFEKQFKDWNYKVGDGESINEVTQRMSNILEEILNKNKDKNIVIVSHGTAITALLKSLCNIKYNDNKSLVEVYFNNALIFDGDWNCPELFKLEFDEDNKLVLIENIKL